VVFAVAVAAAIVFIAQNQTAMVDVHGLGYTWHMHMYWVLVAGLVIAGVGLLGLAMMRSGAAHTARIRTERRGLEREKRPAQRSGERAPGGGQPRRSRQPVVVDREADYGADPASVDPAPAPTACSVTVRGRPNCSRPAGAFSRTRRGRLRVPSNRVSL